MSEEALRKELTDGDTPEVAGPAFDAGDIRVGRCGAIDARKAAGRRLVLVHERAIGGAGAEDEREGGAASVERRSVEREEGAEERAAVQVRGEAFELAFEVGP